MTTERNIPAALLAAVRKASQPKTEPKTRFIPIVPTRPDFLLHSARPYVSAPDWKEVVLTLAYPYDDGSEECRTAWRFNPAQARRLAYLLNQAADRVDGIVIDSDENGYTVKEAVLIPGGRKQCS